MRVQLATAAGSGAQNEDFAAVVPAAAVLLDGAGIPPGVESGCVHGVAWFARTLGTVFLSHIADPASGSLADCLHDAIERVRSLHDGACDISHPGTPTATVVAIRTRDDRLEHLVLADSSLVLTETSGTTRVVTDRRIDGALRGTRPALDQIPLGEPAYAAAFRDHMLAVQRLRNAPGGFWVASADPVVAGQALTGSCALPELQSALLLSDGASRLADLFGLVSWDDLAALVRRDGSAELIRQVRAAEATDPRGRRWQRSKATDDATVIYCDRLGDLAG
jgi:Protein phosphatase 2C